MSFGRVGQAPSFSPSAATVPHVSILNSPTAPKSKKSPTRCSRNHIKNERKRPWGRDKWTRARDKGAAREPMALVRSQLRAARAPIPISRSHSTWLFVSLGRRLTRAVPLPPLNPRDPRSFARGRDFLSLSFSKAEKEVYELFPVFRTSRRFIYRFVIHFNELFVSEIWARISCSSNAPT